MVDRPDIGALAEAVADTVGINGHAIVQILDDGDQLHVLECNSRVGGASSGASLNGLRASARCCSRPPGDPVALTLGAAAEVVRVPIGCAGCDRCVRRRRHARRELDYVESGFRAVASAVAAHHQVDEDAAFALLVESMETHGQGRQFDDLLQAVGAFSVRDRDRLIRSPPAAPPRDLLPEASRRVLEWAGTAGHRVFLVTDGTTTSRTARSRRSDCVFVEHAYLTGRYGEVDQAEHEVFELMLDAPVPRHRSWSRRRQSRLDFVGVRSLGGRTVRSDGRVSHRAATGVPTSR